MDEEPPTPEQEPDNGGKADEAASRNELLRLAKTLREQVRRLRQIHRRLRDLGEEDG